LKLPDGDAAVASDGSRRDVTHLMKLAYLEAIRGLAACACVPPTTEQRRILTV
jgi:hypothetical protein